MTETPETEREFFERVDAFLQLANRLCDGAERAHVSASFLFAVSRFHAFEAARTCASGAELDADREAAMRWFTGRYQAMFEQNLDDYVRNFDAYVASAEDVDPGAS